MQQLGSISFPNLHTNDFATVDWNTSAEYELTGLGDASGGPRGRDEELRKRTRRTQYISQFSLQLAC